MTEERLTPSLGSAKSNGNASVKWVQVFKNGPSKICGRQPLKTSLDMVCLNFTRSILYYFVPNATFYIGTNASPYFWNL